jgi:hypothetical protein
MTTWEFITGVFYTLVFLIAVTALLFGIPFGLGLGGSYIANLYGSTDSCLIGILLAAFGGSIVALTGVILFIVYSDI